MRVRAHRYGMNTSNSQLDLATRGAGACLLTVHGNSRYSKGRLQDMLSKTLGAGPLGRTARAHSPMGLSPCLRSTSLKASAISAWRLLPGRRASVCMTNDISGVKKPAICLRPWRLAEPRCRYLSDLPLPVWRLVGSLPNRVLCQL